MKTRATVRGTATAASIWSTGAIGATVAQGAYAIAVAISVINLAAFLLLTPLERWLQRRAGARKPPPEPRPPPTR